MHTTPTHRFTSQEWEHTFDPSLKSWVEGSSDKDNPFPIQNLPLGVFVPANAVDARVGIAIGTKILDLAGLAEAGLLDSVGVTPGDLHQTSLNALIRRGKDVRQNLRVRVSELLDSNPTASVSTEQNRSLLSQHLYEQKSARLLLPVHVGDFVDFYSSLEHASNVGSMFRDPENPLLPNWKHVPIGYHGRSSSLFVSGQTFFRPCGQVKPENDPPVFRPSSQLDFELEMGFIIGKDTAPGERISALNAHEHMFGMVLVNDWSARDIQKWEYVPLGPFLGKSFATTVSPWVVTMDVIERLQCAEPKRDVPILQYLEDGGQRALDIRLSVGLRSNQMERHQVISETNFRHMYWTINQQLAHMTSNGTPIRTGDLYASGTVSGSDPNSYGSMLELCWKGTKPLQLQDGSTRTFIHDYDDVILMASGTLPGGVVIGFGPCSAQVLPARVF
jgi:fumarylacetoacetase